MSEKDRQKLYCKMSALKSRVKRKREQMWQKQSADDFNSKFERLCEIVAEELNCTCRDTLINCISSAPSKRQKIIAKRDAHQMSSEISQAEFLAKVKEFCGQ